MEFSAKQLAAVLGGTIEGDENVLVSDYAKIEEGRPGAISFLSNPKYEHYIYTTEASVVLVNNDFKPAHEVKATLLRVPDAYLALSKLLKLAEHATKLPAGISPLAYVSPTANVSPEAAVAPFAYVGNDAEVGAGTQLYPGSYVGDGAKVGENCIIYSNASIYKGCVIGDRCILHSSSVIGADGFGFAKNAAGEYEKMPQVGNVILGSDVEIGASSTIDRGSMGPTILHDGVKIDNQVQVAHNVEIGENTAIAACSGVAGSTKIGKNCILAGKVGVTGHVTIADGTILAAGTNLQHGIDKAGIYQGSPALPIYNAKRSFAVYKNLPELSRKISALEKELQELKDLLKSDKI